MEDKLELSEQKVEELQSGGGSGGGDALARAEVRSDVERTLLVFFFRTKRCARLRRLRLPNWRRH